MDKDTDQLPDTAEHTLTSVDNATSTEAAPTEQKALAFATPSQDSVAWFKQKRFVWGVALTLVIVSGITSWLVLSGSSDQKQSASQSATSQERLLGATATVVDGTAQVSLNGGTWQELKVGATIAQGSTIRTAQDGRLVITLDDGSAVRLNNTSTAKLASLAADNIQFTNEGGEVYTRVVASKRTFSVSIGDESYVALGTAYKTVNRDTTKGVEVYQSEVSTKKAGLKVAEGKRYYQANPTTDLDKKVSDIPTDQLQKDDFLKWNLEHDKKADEFKDKLGYLTTLEKTPAPVSAPVPVPAPAPVAGSIALSGNQTEKGAGLTWKVVGLTVNKGFMIVKSAAANPVYSKKADAVFVAASARTYNWKITDGKTYHFRVCVYNTDGSCTNYSNDIAVSAPYVAPPSPPSGSLSLSHVSGTNVAWTLSGSAPYGLKLVWSESTGPVYPGGSAKYYDGASTASATFDGTVGKTYYVRVCMYYEGTCQNYSNEITVTLP